MLSKERLTNTLYDNILRKGVNIKIAFGIYKIGVYVFAKDKVAFLLSRM